jgi:hypothetical protein
MVLECKDWVYDSLYLEMGRYRVGRIGGLMKGHCQGRNVTVLGNQQMIVLNQKSKMKEMKHLIFQSFYYWYTSYLWILHEYL